VYLRYSITRSSHRANGISSWRRFHKRVLGACKSVTRIIQTRGEQLTRYISRVSERGFWNSRLTWCHLTNNKTNLSLSQVLSPVSIILLASHILIIRINKWGWRLIFYNERAGNILLRTKSRALVIPGIWNEIFIEKWMII